jgi:adenosylcobinamide-phosphate synthase
MLGIFLPVLVCAMALLLDRLFGEPRLHPLILFGNVANWLEKKLNNRQSRFNGAIAALWLISFPVTIVYIAQTSIESEYFQGALDLLILTFVIGWQSMKEHAEAVAKPLLAGDLSEARRQLAMIVSRNTEDMDEELIVGSTIESVLENGHDCVFASIFWFALLGPAGALMHRLANTLDAMWGYKNERYLQFGFFAARFDDVLGYLPARLTAISYAFSGSLVKAFTAWKNQIGQHKSPNAGLVMASGAGALEIVIGGPVKYDGVPMDKPYLGVGERAVAADIGRSIKLIEKSLMIWLLMYAAINYAVS